MQWRKVKTADYDQFQLIVINEYKGMNPDAFVYDHEGKQLFFYAYSPEDVPVFPYHQFIDLDAIRAAHEQYAIHWSPDSPPNYSSKGTDCDGVPTFSHLTADYIATHKRDITVFEPLTVKTVTHWVGWFLYNLNNSKLQIGTSQ